MLTKHWPVNFIAKIRKERSGCWRWTAAITKYGYGAYTTPAHVHWRAHRYAFFCAHGYVPVWPFVLDHLCRNRWCVNPAHLEEVSLRENILRGKGLAAKHASLKACLRGHAFTAANTYVYVSRGREHRHCRECHRLRETERRLRKCS